MSAKNQDPRTLGVGDHLEALLAAASASHVAAKEARSAGHLRPLARDARLALNRVLRELDDLGRILVNPEPAAVRRDGFFEVDEDGHVIVPFRPRQASA